jgi:hypothetical protein
VCDGVVRDVHGAVVRQVTGIGPQDEDCVARLVAETQGSVLVFCPSKSSVENIAKRLAALLRKDAGAAVNDRLAQEAHVACAQPSMYGPGSRHGNSL